ncbi:MAG: hypothetical protein AUI16_02985 [Alphaproteobacteria bacterium 13_2_20CM_2_64_7]|nr:MAG: hypothetical protein AUI16_02985 [Alphaproteobacteria bacterium 13_2_20CM_2_64_7]
MLDRRPAVSSLEPLEPWTWYRNEDGLPFLRGCRDEAAAKKAFEGNRMRRHIGAINYLRATEWRLNDYMLDVYQSWIVEPLLEISQHRRDKGRRDLLQWDRIQASLLRGKTFWTDMHCEWRGRALPIPYFNYGRDDAMRSLFRFAKGAPIGERGIYWLKVSLANCYGGDIARKTFDQRAAWVDANMDRLRELVSNPAQTLKYTKDTKVVEVMLGGKLVPAFKTPLLKEASDPFQLLAHAHELVACNNNPKFETTLPLPFDASNSGAQYYSVLKRDRKGARLTNLIDAKRPNDLYFNICARAEGRVTSLIKDADAKMSERLRAVWAKSKGLITRKVIKGIVVAYLYGQQTGGATKKLTLTLRQAKTELVVEDIHTVDPSEDFDGKMGTEVTWRWPTKEEFPKGYLGWFTKIVHEEIAAAIPGAAEVRGYIRSLADVLGSHGKVLEWESPTGVPISNRYHGSDMSTIKMWLGALPTRIEHDVPVGYEPELDGDRCSQGAAANLIHSIEASHMALVALACERAGIPLVTVHDCFGTLGCYVEDLRRIWLEELRNLFKDENILQDLHNYAREVLGPDVELPPVPTRGVLRIEEINGRYALS